MSQMLTCDECKSETDIDYGPPLLGSDHNGDVLCECCAENELEALYSAENDAFERGDLFGPEGDYEQTDPRDNRGYEYDF